MTNYSEWINICDEFDRLTASSLCKISFDMDVSFKFDGSNNNIHKMVTTCFQGIADKLFNPIGCTVSITRSQTLFDPCILIYLAYLKKTMVDPEYIQYLPFTHLVLKL